MTVSAGRSRSAPPPPGPGEWLLVLLIFAVGCGIRFAWPERLAIEHFDEGVYASNVWFGPEEAFRYPEQHFYSPPLLPTLIEWIFTLAGPSNFGAMLPSLVSGSLTILLVWWAGRCWFGPIAGLAAATLCALSDAHVVFSRSALTDVLLCFWVLLAVHLMWRALTTGKLWPTVGAGLFTGLAWWTKYNGWLPIAIGVAGLIPWLIQRKLTSAEFNPARLVRPISRLVGISAVAFAIWSPWLWSLQSRGGYGTVAANHRKYFVGLSGWWTSATEQVLKLQELSATATSNALLIALLVSLVASSLTTQRFTWNRLGQFLANRGVPLLAFTLLVAAVQKFLGPAPIALGLGAAGLALLHLGGWRVKESESTNLAAWLLTAWFAGMTVSTPAYTPYPRLLLPWLVATWLAVGFLVQWIVLAIDQAESESANDAPAEPAITFPTEERNPSGDGMTPRPCRKATVISLLAGLLAIMAATALPLRVPGWEGRTAIRSAAIQFSQVAEERVGSTVGSGRPFVIYTISEPALLFQLRLQGLEHVRPVSSLRLAHTGAPQSVIPTFVAIGRQARSMPGFQSEQWEPASGRLKPVDSAQVIPSPLVRLDDSDWSKPADADRCVMSLFELD